MMRREMPTHPWTGVMLRADGMAGAKLFDEGEFLPWLKVPGWSSPETKQQLRVEVRDKVVRLLVNGAQVGEKKQPRLLTSHLTLYIAGNQAAELRVSRIRVWKLAKQLEASSSSLDVSVPASVNGITNPAEATKERRFVNSLGMKFVPVPGTKVLMCIHETRKGDYAAYANEQAGVDGTWRNLAHRGLIVSASDDHPVCGVNWNDAKAFCVWLSARESVRYRLPTDREWSFAIGIAERENPSKTPSELKNGIPDVWPWGTSFPPPSALENLADESLRRAVPDHPCIANYDDGFPTTAPVMSFPANAIGLYDMGGNVCEWTEDIFGGEFPTARSVRTDGFLGSRKDWCLASHRTPRDPVKTRSVSFGFRVVLELP